MYCFTLKEALQEFLKAMRYRKADLTEAFKLLDEAMEVAIPGAALAPDFSLRKERISFLLQRVRPSPRLTYSERIRLRAYCRIILDKVQACAPARIKTKRRPVSFAETLTWQIKAFFAAPGDDERQLCVILAETLTGSTHVGWYDLSGYQY